MTVLERADWRTPRDQDARDREHKHERRHVHVAALAGWQGDRVAQRDAEQRVEQLNEICRCR